MVTPTLFVGWNPVGWGGGTDATTAKEAVAVIDSGGIAVLPPNAWDVAQETLTLLGVDPEWQQVVLGRARR